MTHVRLKSTACTAAGQQQAATGATWRLTEGDLAHGDSGGRDAASDSCGLRGSVCLSARQLLLHLRVTLTQVEQLQETLVKGKLNDCARIRLAYARSGTYRLRVESQTKTLQTASE